MKIHSRCQSSYYPQESESIRELLIAREHPIAKRSYHSWTSAWKTKFLYVIASRMLESTSFTSDNKRASDSKSLSILDLCLRNEVLI